MIKPNEKPMRSTLYSVILTILIAILIFSCSYLPSDEDLANTIIYHETPDYISLSTNNEQDNIGFMFLPGGLVDPHAYLTLMERVVSDSINVIILKYSANLAILELSKYKKFISEFPGIDSWYIGGHSLGGIAALSAVNDDPTLFDGLILLGSYPSEGFAIPDWEKQVLSIYAENDQLSTVEDVTAAVSYLPPARFISDIDQLDTLNANIPGTLYYCILGGNHSQFGDYGFQNGDGAAEISVEEQHEEIHSAIIKYIKRHNNE